MNSEYDLTKFDKVLADVAEIQDKGNFLPDCATKDGYEASKRFVLDVTTPARKALELAHKETKKPFWDACKFLDEKKKELMPILEAVEAPHKEAYKAVDEEKKRIKALKEAEVQKGFDDISALVESSINQDSDFISNLLSQCTEFDVNPDIYGQRTNELIKHIDSAVSKLTEALTQRIQFEEMTRQQAELAERQAKIEAEEARIQAAKDEEERLKHEAKIREEAAIEAKRQAELESAEREEKAKQALIDAEKAAKQSEKQRVIDAQLAEEKRLADIEAAKQAEILRQQQQSEAERLEAEKREANKKHQAKIHNTILKVLLDNGISEEDAKTMIMLAAKKQLPNLTINY